MTIPRTTMPRNRGLFLALALFSAPFLAHGAEVKPEEGETKKKPLIFRVLYKNIDDAYLLARPALSPEGSIFISPKNNEITIYDTPEAIQRVEDILAAFDTPPKTIEMEIKIIKGEMQPVGEGPVKSNPIRGEAERLKNIYDKMHYSLVDHVKITATEGVKTTVEFPNAPNYKLEVTVDYVDVKRKLMSLKPFRLLVKKSTLNRESKDYTTLVATEYVITEYEDIILGGSDDMTPNYALFFSCNATILDSGGRVRKE